MDVLIKNMTLPTEDEQVNITILSDGSVIEHFRTEKGRWTSYRSGGVTATELPEHGRLIDADALMEQTENWYCSKENCGDNYNGIRCRACWVDDTIGIIDDAPTVLEAST